MAYKSKFTGQQIDDYLDNINNKQDKLVDGVNMATINGQSLTEGGDITISCGVSEDYVNTAIANAITTTLNTAV